MAEYAEGRALLMAEPEAWEWYLREVRFAGEQAFVAFDNSRDHGHEKLLEVSAKEGDRLRSHIGKRGVLRFVVDGEDEHIGHLIQRADVEADELIDEARA